MTGLTFKQLGFKPGDKVRCIRDRGFKYDAYRGGVVLADKEGAPCIREARRWLDGCEGEWELVTNEIEIPLKAACQGPYVYERTTELPPVEWRESGPGDGEGRKDDTGKDRIELVPPELVFAVAKVLTFGAQKYDDRNWEKGMSWGRVFGAMMRHLWAWWRGEAKDEETGFSHLWHAGCCLAFLIAYEERKIGTDDRLS